MTFLWVILMLVAVYQFAVACCAVHEHPKLEVPNIVVHVVATAIYCPLAVLLVSCLALLAIWN